MKLRNLYNRICSLQSYFPSEEVNALFFQLVEFVLDDSMSHDLSDQEISHLQNICSQAEGEMEKYWVKELVSGSKKLEDFWYYSNYVKLTKLEFFALQGCSHHVHHRK
jgi:nicotianamine synthase